MSEKGRGKPDRHAWLFGRAARREPAASTIPNDFVDWLIATEESRPDVYERMYQPYVDEPLRTIGAVIPVTDGDHMRPRDWEYERAAYTLAAAETVYEPAKTRKQWDYQKGEWRTIVLEPAKESPYARPSDPGTPWGSRQPAPYDVFLEMTADEFWAQVVLGGEKQETDYERRRRDVLEHFGRLPKEEW
jgi:hypothetical protein